jgi:hypothetical protein
MLDQTTLKSLKAKLPKQYNIPIRSEYFKLYKEQISRQSIWRFFNGVGYTEKIHKAVLSVAEMQHSLQKKTEDIINA